MNRDEAFQILGLPPDADRQQARRAYLRQVKEHKPDEDPEGFRRIREAYELISAAPVELVVVPEPSEPAAEPAFSPSPVSQPIEDETLRREAVELPDEENMPAFLLARSLELARQGGDGADVVPEMIRTAFEKPPIPDSAGTMALQVFFVLQSAGALDAADRVFELIEKHPDIFGGDADDVANFQVHFVWAEELMALSRSFPQKLRSAIAQGVLTGDTEEASDAMHYYAMVNPELSSQVGDLLKSSPRLFNLYHHVLSGPRSETYAKSPYLRGGLGFVAIWLLVQVLRSCEPSPYSSYTSNPTISYETVLRQEAVSEARSVLQAHCGGPIKEPTEPICILGFDYVDAARYRSCTEAREKRLELEKLNLEYPEKPLFDDVAFDVLGKVYDVACDPRYVAVDPETP